MLILQERQTQEVVWATTIILCKPLTQLQTLVKQVLLDLDLQ
jgi:hypothetical protein